MNKQQRAVKTAEHSRISFEMNKKERTEAFKKAIADKKAAEELAARKVKLEAKRVRGLAHYKSKLENAKRHGKK